MKHLAKIIVIALVALGVSLGLWMYLNGSLIKSKADVKTANLRFAPITNKVNDGAEVGTSIIITSSGNPFFSGVDLSFTTTGEGLDFVRYTLPAGFTEQILDASKISTATAPKQLLRLVFVATKPASALPTSITIPLFFKATAPNGDRNATPRISVNVSASQIVGPGGTFTIMPDPAASNFTLSFNPPPSDAATAPECDVARNMSNNDLGCGRAVSFTWTDASNEDGYKIYRKGSLIATIAKNSISYTDRICNFAGNTYTIEAYNLGGSKKTDVTCKCLICPTLPPPTPSPIPPPSSADLLFHAVFPDADASVNQITDVKITLLDSNGNTICNDGVDCAKIVTFQRDTTAKMPNTFNSPRLGYDLEKNRAYTVMVKQNHTVRQMYKRVYLTWKDILQCKEGTQDSRCGDLISAVEERTLFSGDLDNSNTVDEADLEIVNRALGFSGAEGDLNFDGKTNQKDLTIVSKNFEKNGT